MNTTHAPRPGRSRRLVLGGAVSVALISTVSAYLAMTAFGRDLLGMDTTTAYTTAGVFELSLVTVALLAREAAQDTRPSGTLLTLTWVLSSTSGLFAAAHEVYLAHAPGAVAFRFVVPLLAALMWHLSLLGDRHLASGTSWSSLRQTARMHALFLTTEDAVRVHAHDDGSPAARRAIARAEARRRRARAVALRTVPPEQMRAQVSGWLDSLSAVSDAISHVARMHIEASSRVSNTPDKPVGHLSAVRPVRAPRTTRTARTGPSARTVRLDIISALLTARPGATASDALTALGDQGHIVTDRTARRLLADARAARTQAA